MLAAGDPRLAPYIGLKDSSLRRRLEPEQGLFVLEGKLALVAALASGYPLVSVLVSEHQSLAIDELGLPPEVPVYVADDEVLRVTTGFNVHRGVLAVAERLPLRRPEDVLRGAGSPVLVVEDVNDQENLGAIFRNAAAFGAVSVLLSPRCADPLYRRTVRVSLGYVLQARYARLEPWPQGLGLVAEAGYQLLALTPRAGAERIERVAAELTDRPVALVVGAEGPGLSEAVLSMCRPVRVAMAPGVDSLNVAAATAVALYCVAAVP